MPPDCLFADILVAIGGSQPGWQALQQALEIGRREQGKIHGLTLIPCGEKPTAALIEAIQAEFNRLCAARGIPGRLVIESGEVVPTICSRAYWTDLVVVNLTYPPKPTPTGRLTSGFHTLVQRCPRPVLAVPGRMSPLERMVLAYDGSAKADEALYVPAYLCARWHIALTVVTAVDRDTPIGATQGRAKNYLAAHRVDARYVERVAPASQLILDQAADSGSTLIVMGGYGAAPVLELVLGSTVDRVLQEFRWPVLICR